MLSKSLTVIGMASAASAHLLLANPTAWGGVNNSPLDKNGLDFPCKNAASDGSGNTWAQGEEVALAFTGSAVHGGGSCQVSLTTDLAPTKNSVWKVIKTFEGGCPVTADANLPVNPAGAISSDLMVKIHEQIPAGQYTFAWTWFNRIGNREMYMNCGSATIEGSGGDTAFYESLPPMYTANIFGDGVCETEETYDLQFPAGFANTDDPAQYRVLSQNLKAGPTDGCSVGGGGSPASPAPPSYEPGAPSASAGPSASAAPTSPAEPAPVAPSAVASASMPGGVYINDPAAPTQQPAAPDTPEATMPQTPQTPGSGSGSGSGAGAEAAGSACSSEGMWNCIGGNSFQRCASGRWTEVIAMATGTGCEAGQSAELKFSAARGKRSMRRTGAARRSL